MSSLAPLETELKEIQESIREQIEKKQTILREIEDVVKERFKAAQKKLRITLPIGILVALGLWIYALQMNLSKNTGAANEQYPCAIPVFLVIGGIAAIVISIWLGIPKESAIRRQAIEERNAEVEEVNRTLGPLQAKERQLKQELERLHYVQR
ncbi:MAG: hypothetical protein GXY52_06460 [Chloroflexi bacterium]|nr:hypothetical protein [Chloroflexota bacterium]